MHSYVESRLPGGLVYVMFSTTGAAMVSGTKYGRLDQSGMTLTLAALPAVAVPCVKMDLHLRSKITSFEMCCCWTVACDYWCALW